MSQNLQALLNAARSIQMTQEQREQQRRSFAYGNTHIENERVTRTTIEDAARSLAEEDSEQ
jgi:hypothetical protein